MSSVLDPSALADSPLADLHLLANELGVDGFRRLRKADLIDAIVARQAGEDFVAPEAAPAADEEEDGAPARGRRGRRGGRGRARRDEDEREGEAAPAPARERERGGRGGRGGRGERPERAERTERAEVEDEQVEGVIELLGNGSAFVRLTAGETDDDDVYVSAAQVKRCELVSGDRVSGPMRPALGSEDPTVKAIEWLTPFGKGSRVTIVGPARAGKSEALRRIAAALAEQGGVELAVVLAGVRPEEVPDWQAGPAAPTA